MMAVVFLFPVRRRSEEDSTKALDSTSHRIEGVTGIEGAENES